MDIQREGSRAHRPADPGGGLDADERRSVTLLCIVLIVLTLAAPLIASLPEALEAAANAAPLTARAFAGGAPERHDGNDFSRVVEPLEDEGL